MEAFNKARSSSGVPRHLVCCLDRKEVLSAPVMPSLLPKGEQAAGKCFNSTCSEQSRYHWKLSLQLHFISWWRDWGHFNQRRTIWWAQVIGFMTNFACAIWEWNWYDITWAEWKHCQAMLVVFSCTAGTIGLLSHFGGSVPGLWCAVLATAAAARRLLTSLGSILSRDVQRSFRLDGLDKMLWVFFFVCFSAIQEGENNDLIKSFPFLYDIFGINFSSNLTGIRALQLGLLLSSLT